MTKVFVTPHFRGEDKGDGGIRRVVEAQHKWLPHYGVEVVDNPRDADVFAVHAGAWHEAFDAPEASAKPIIAHCHGLYWEGYIWERWALNLNKDVISTMRKADHVTAPSEWVGHALARGMWCNPTVLYHGIDPEDWPEPNNKKYEYVLWNKSRVDAVCDPEPVNELAKRAGSVLGFVTTYGEPAPNVKVTGRVTYEEAKRYVTDAGVYLCTARETFGIGTLEAMCAGVPILGWDWGGQAEFVKHKVHGYLAKPGDYDDLAEGLLFCVTNQREITKAARAYVLKNFTWEQRIKPYAELYSKWIEDFRSRPRVSVVITNYNLGRYLKDAVDSALNAGLKGKDLEVVVVDDASTEPIPDDVQTLIDQNDNVKLIKNETNQYLAEALNTGISRSRGRYVLPLDADNMLPMNALRLMADALDKDRRLDIAYGAMRVVDESGANPDFVSSWPPQHADLTMQLIHRNQISSTALYRRKVWETVGGYRGRCRTAEDADFWCRALSVGFVGRKITDAATLIYRDRADSMSHVQKDWDWHKWYSYGLNPKLRLWSAGGDNIPAYEFPTVSVVIPVGPGHERLVLDALDSIQNQTFKHWEAVVVNDTGRPLPWVHPWARVITPYVSMGAASARNVGIKHAKAPYIVFLDADDWLHPDALRVMGTTIDKCGGFVYSDWFVGETGEYKEAPDFDPNDVLKQLPYPVTCMYKRADLVDRGVEFNTDFDGKGWEDWDFALQVVAKHGICGHRIDAPLFHYRLGSGTLRDKAYVARDSMKQEILARWGDYISGKEPNMARGCGGCGGSRSFRAPVAYNNGTSKASANTQADEGDQPTVMLEYVGEDTGYSSYVGRVTGVRYRFGSDPAHRVRRVFESDAKHLMALGWFKEHTASSNDAGTFEPLQAAGPPKR